VTETLTATRTDGVPIDLRPAAGLEADALPAGIFELVMG
jgi:hypothetical protein